MKDFPQELRHGSGALMHLDNTRLLLSFRKEKSLNEMESLLKEQRLALENVSDHSNEEQSNHSFVPIINHTATKFWVKADNGRKIDDNWYNEIKNNLSNQLEWIGPVYRIQNTLDYDGLLCPLPHVLIIKPKRKNEGEIENIVKPFDLREVAAKSRYLNDFYYVTTNDALNHPVYQTKNQLLKESREVIEDIKFENMPILKPLALVPNDPIFATQWNMTKIHAPEAWDISTGINSVIVAVLDTGVDLRHIDLQLASNGVDLGDMTSDGSPNAAGTDTGHGTCCAGIIAAIFNNAEGVSGVAGSCRILPIAFNNWTDAECAAGINYAYTHGASVISMSFGQYAPGERAPSGWDFSIIDPAITNAFSAGVIMCAATGNENNAANNRYPGRHPLVLACGATSTDDNRKSPASPDGEFWWGSNYAEDVYNGTTTGVSVVAPGVQIPTTDIQGAGGYNPNTGTAGNYFNTFNGTSSATPHVAGLAALIRSRYPALVNGQVRRVIERTADKVGTLGYSENPVFTNGTRNQQMGYGRINSFRALDFADVMIKDWSGDNGIEPSTPPGGDFWDFSDIVVRVTDDNIFNPGNPSQSKNVEKGQSNFIYIQVTNNGPRDARDVVVDCRITPWIGLQFRYPDDWTNIDPMHVQPIPVMNSFSIVPAGSTVLAKFSIPAAQTDTLYGWENGHPWHPCLLASVGASNDYAFSSAAFLSDPLSQLKNNLAQRNLTVIDILADATASPLSFPFVAGHIRNNDRFMKIVVENIKPVPNVKMLLCVDDDGKSFPLVDFEKINELQQQSNETEDNGITFLETTKIKTTLGCNSGILTVVKGSRFDCHQKKLLNLTSVKGGEIILRNGKRYVEIQGSKTIVQLEKEPGKIYPMSVLFEFSPKTIKDNQMQIRVTQQDQRGVTVGGAGAIYYFN